MEEELYTRIGAVRSGNDYQDIVAIGYLIEMLENPNRFQWIRFEADDAMSLDDIIVCSADGKLDAIQVKYSTHPSQPADSWGWEEIIKQKNRKNGGKLDSLFQKWFKSLNSLRSSLNRGMLYTNRSASEDIRTCLTGYFVQFDKIEQATQQILIEQADNDTAAVHDFFSSFEWRFDQPSLGTYEELFKRRFFKMVGEDEESWYSLKEAVNRWVIHKNAPTSDGKIFINNLRSAINWNLSPSIPQEFEIPLDYVIPDSSFHKQFIDNILSSKEGRCVVLTGKPAVGKSTYLSHFVQILRKKSIPVVRHHYYLSLDDHTSFRYDHKRIIESLMKDLIEIESIQNAMCSGELQQLQQNPRFDVFGDWLLVLSQFLVKKDQQLVIIIDGLDHVWRDQRDIVELRKLFDCLLPPYDHICIVIGTQPVDDVYLPSKLLEYAPREEWCYLPYLNDKAMKKWLSSFVKTYRVNPFDHDASERYKKDYAGRLLSRIKDKSLGHPLIIKYILRRIIDNNALLSPDYIASLPEVPDQDIGKYYESLWRAISPDSRTVLEIYAASGFTWLSNDIVECINYLASDKLNTFQSWRNVSHLFQDTLLGYAPFHPSLLQFIREKDDYTTQEQIFLESIEKWLLEKAPPYWKWSYTWEIQARLGKSTEIINGVGRAWAIESIALGYPIYRILEICELCRMESFRSSNFRKLAEISQLSIYIENCTSEYPNLLGDISLSQLYLKDDTFIIELWKTGLSGLSSGRLAILAEVLYRDGDREGYKNIIQILDDRLKSTHSSYELPEALSGILGTLFLDDSINIRIENILSNLCKYRNQENHTTVLKSYINALVRRNKCNAFRDLLSHELTPYESYITTNGYITSALVEGFCINNIDIILINSPLVVFYGCIAEQDVTSCDADAIYKLDSSFLSLSNYEITLKREAVSDGMYNVFFYYLAKYLLSQEPTREDYYSRKIESWQHSFVSYLKDLAAKYYQSIRQKPRHDVFTALSSVTLPDAPSWEDDRAGYDYYKPACESFSQIILTLILAEHRFCNLILNKIHLSILIENQYFDLWHFIQNFLAHRIKLLAADAIDWLNHEYDHLKEPHSSIVRDSGAHRYALLAELNCFYNHPNEAKDFIRKSINSGIVYGYHKDPLAYRILECLHETLIHTDDREQIKEWIDVLLPSLMAIRDYTDGHAYHDLTGSILFKIDPSLAMSYYDVLIGKEEYHGALEVFQEILGNTDFNNYCISMLGMTAIDNESIQVLLKKSANNQEVIDVINTISKAVGPLAIEACKDKLLKEEEEHRKYDRKIDVDYSCYPVEKCDELVSLVKATDYYDFEKYALEWFAYWKTSYPVEQRLEVLDFFGKNARLNPNWIMYELISEQNGFSKAYPYLIEYFKDKRGWSIYGLGEEHFGKVIDAVIKNHPTKITSFINDTISTPSLSDPVSVELYFNFSRLVRYFIASSNKTTAYEIINGVFDTYTGLVRPFNISQVKLSVEHNRIDEFGIEMLMRRLLWITPMVREQSCKAIAELLVNQATAPATETICFKHLAKQTLESRTVVFLLPLFRAKTISEDYRLPYSEAILNAIKRPSYLSNILMNELGYDTDQTIDWEEWNDIPDGYVESSNWKSIISRFPPKLVSIINGFGTISHELMTRWSFEYDEIIHDYGFTPAPSGDNIGGLRDQEHFLRLEIPYFEIGYSALLRMITWAVSKLQMPEGIALRLSLQCLPLDLDSIKIDFTDKPPWVPQIDLVNSSGIDTITPSLVRIAAELTTQVIDGCRIGYFDARFIDRENEKYDLKIEAIYQRCRGPHTPNQSDINELSIQPSLTFPKMSPFLCTEFQSSLDNHAVHDVKDWLLMPATGSLYPYCPSFWHINRRRRYFFISAPYYPYPKTNQILQMKSHRNGIDYYVKANLVGKWFDWVENMPEQVFADIPQNIGSCLLMEDSFTNAFCQRHGLTFCWLVTITTYAKEKDYGDFLKTEYKDIIGGVNIIVNPSYSLEE